MVKFGLKFIYFSFFRCLIEKADLKDTRVFLPKKLFILSYFEGKYFILVSSIQYIFWNNLHRKTSEFLFLPQP